MRIALNAAAGAQSELGSLCSSCATVRADASFNSAAAGELSMTASMSRETTVRQPCRSDDAGSRSSGSSCRLSGGSGIDLAVHAPRAHFPSIHNDHSTDNSRQYVTRGQHSTAAHTDGLPITCLCLALAAAAAATRCAARWVWPASCFLIALGVSLPPRLPQASDATPSSRGDE
jgi:hypothetical protein